MTIGNFNRMINSIFFIYVVSLYVFTYLPFYNLISNAIAIVLISLIWIKKTVFSKKIHYNTYFIIIFIFILFGLSTSFKSLDIEVATSKLITLTSLAILSFSLYNHFQETYSQNVVSLSFITSGLIAVLYIFMTSDFSDLGRFGNQLGNVNAIGLILTISAVFSFYSGLSSKNKVYLIFAIILSIFVLLTGSRKSLILLVFSIASLALLMSTNVKRFFKFSSLSALIMIIIFYLINNNQFFYNIIGTRFEDLIDLLFNRSLVDDESIIVRQDMIVNGIQWFKQNPLIGFGLDNYRILYGSLRGEYTYSHNNFVEILVSSGIIGFIIYHLSLLIVLYHGFKNRSSNNIINPLLVLTIGVILLSPSLVFYDSKVFSIIFSLLCITKFNQKITESKKVLS